MIRRPPRSTRVRSSAASDVYKRQPIHLAAMKQEILEKMMEKKITALSFENLKDDTGHNPIVRSMSEIAGSAVMLIAGQYLSNANNGKGVLVGGISGIPPTKVIIIGAGIVCLLYTS